MLARSVMRAHLPSYDSIQEFEQARHDRLWDGLTLWSDGHTNSPAGAVYLLGYSVEMMLKCAYFRVLGLGISDHIGNQELKTARAKAKMLGVVHDAESFHSVLFWCDLLCAQRVAVNKPLAPPFVHRLARETGIVYDHWSVEMRYKASRTTPMMLESLIATVEWFDLNYTLLHT